ncbi:hypothetical protein E6C50_09620 [Flavobacterium supellecticarium]|uniref:Tetratricopeptide repeat-containing protein n=1 Tax=Flavobacterium supellecticarium TaxID=2565924 RepID=A0A4S3ZX71_9FLAO|nr:hypothetical protein [Flavobacterium supellecticarium]THF50478.1 hypothetical protein E6C50_09620 [Flavobacterium supellecticarium]
MIRNSLKKWLLGCSLLAGVTYTVIYACSDIGDWGYYYLSNFTPEAYVDKSYSPLFYSGDIFYTGYDGDFTGRFNDAIVTEWDGYLNGKIKKEDIAYFIANDSASTELLNLYQVAVNKKKLTFPDRKIDLKNKKVKDFLEFMYYARQIEKHTTISYDYWDYDNRTIPQVAPELIRTVEQKFEQTQDAFLKNRYWFQTMKAYFYSNSKPKTIAFFEKTQNSVPKNTLYYRGLSYVAGCYYKQQNYVKANYFYAVVFDKCPALRQTTAYNFHPQEQSDFNASLQLAQHTDEKTALWALLGYYADEQKAIAEIYKLNPKSEHLEYLLTRLVNKEEIRLNDDEFRTIPEYKKKINEKLNKEMVALVDKIADESQTAKPYLWNSAAGYLNIFKGDYKRAAKLFDKAESQAPKSELSDRQFRLLKLINTISTTTKMNAKSEAALLKELKWLYLELPKEENELAYFRYNKAKEWSARYIASLYASQKNGVMAELFLRDKTYYHKPESQEAMKAFLSKSNKSEWEQMAVKLYNVTLSDIYDYQGVISAYNNKIDQAITYMEQSERSNDSLWGNPFNGKIKDCNDCDHAAYQKVKYTKLSFLQKIKEMQDKLAKGEDVYSNNLLLGNAFYNMTYYGNARAFYDDVIMAQWGNYIDEFYQPILLSTALANAYYKKAFAAATNPEQKARCMYMMAKCERNDFYSRRYHTTDTYYRQAEVSFLAWDGFQKLKSDYSNTQYYKEVIKECGYFRKYLGME